jgi:hypothetical protein
MAGVSAANDDRVRHDSHPPEFADGRLKKERAPAMTVRRVLSRDIQRTGPAAADYGEIGPTARAGSLILI